MALLLLLTSMAPIVNYLDYKVKSWQVYINTFIQINSKLAKFYLNKLGEIMTPESIYILHK